VRLDVALEVPGLAFDLFSLGNQARRRSEENDSENEYCFHCIFAQNMSELSGRDSTKDRGKKIARPFQDFRSESGTNGVERIMGSDLNI
jgi:hypothetical protein